MFSGNYQELAKNVTKLFPSDLFGLWFQKNKVHEKNLVLLPEARIYCQTFLSAALFRYPLPLELKRLLTEN